MSKAFDSSQTHAVKTSFNTASTYTYTNPHIIKNLPGAENAKSVSCYKLKGLQRLLSQARTKGVA